MALYYPYYAVAMLKENKVLTYLRLDVAPKSLFDVCSAVGMNTALTSLDLSFNKFDDRSIASLGKLLKYMITSMGYFQRGREHLRAELPYPGKL